MTRIKKDLKTGAAKIISKPNMAKTVLCDVTQQDIDSGLMCDPTKCMIRVASARAINIPHGYIKVDATGVSVTRRTDYREKAFLPHNVIKNLLLFDDEKTRHLVKPFRFKLVFHKTTKVYKASDRRMAQINEARRNKPKRVYTWNTRVHGFAVSNKVADILKKPSTEKIAKNTNNTSMSGEWSSSLI